MRVAVSVPITGIYYTEIEVPDDADPEAIYAAALDDFDPQHSDITYEFCQIVAEGNIFHGELNEWEFGKIGGAS